MGIQLWHIGICSREMCGPPKEQLLAPSICASDPEQSDRFTYLHSTGRKLGLTAPPLLVQNEECGEEGQGGERRGDRGPPPRLQVSASASPTGRAFSQDW